MTLSGVVKYSDDTPVEDARIQFKAVPTEGIQADETAEGNFLGQFKVKVLKGLTGEITGSLQAWTGEYENCPHIDALIAAGGQRYAIIKTPPLKIVAAQDLNDLVLRLPLPRCNKK